MPAGGELVIQGPDGQPRTVPLITDRIALGRSSLNELCYPEDAGLSRQHLVFEKGADGWMVRDLGSKNGTQVNSVRIAAPHLLKPGDRILAGHLQMQFQPAEGAAPNQTVFFVADTTSPASTTMAVDLEGVLRKNNADAAPLGAGKSIRALIRAGQELSGHRALAELFPLILDLASEAVGAKRAVLMTLEKDELVVRAAHGSDFQISTAVRDRVLKEKKSLLVQDAQFDAEFSGRQSIVMQGMRSIMAAPLQTRDRVIGLIYVDTQDLIKPFTEEDLSLLTVMANVAAIRIEQSRLAEVEQAEKIMARELSQAAEIQRGLLPAEAPKIPGMDLDGQNFPCHTVGGDYYDYFDCAEGRIGIVVADVAGKGMPAAMMMSSLQAHMQVLMETAASPAQIVKRLNRSISARCPGNRFITFFLGLLDPVTGEMTYCNAGHNPPLLVRADGTVEMLEGGGMILGIVPGSEYEERTTRMNAGDLLALYSDGVTEACRPDCEEEFGEKRLGEVLAAHCKSPSSAIIAAVMKDLTEWCSGQAFADDVTILVARRLANATPAKFSTTTDPIPVTVPITA
jgi:sigma-B regulation protein RsbU (phosphoserine phosphatase)